MNPSSALARRVAQDPRWRLAQMTVATAEIPTTWSAQAVWPDLIRRHRPDVVILFGLAGRRRHVSIETRAINRCGVLRPDADRRLAAGLAVPGEPFARTSRAPCRRLLAGLRRASIPARLSINAGDYLCNAALWTVLGETMSQPIPVVFIHIPKPAARLRPKAARARLTLAQLDRAAVVIIRTMRRAAVSGWHTAAWPKS